MESKTNNNLLDLLPTGKVNNDDMKDRIMNTLQDVDDDDKVDRLLLFYEMGTAMSKASVDCIVMVLQNARNRERKAYVAGMEQSCKPEQKQRLFSTKEAMKVANIKSMTTMIKYLRNGTIKGNMNAKGEWTITREAISDYLHVNDF